MKSLFLHLGLKKLVKKMSQKDIENFRLEYQCFRNSKAKHFPGLSKIIIGFNEYVKKEYKKR